MSEQQPASGTAGPARPEMADDPTEVEADRAERRRRRDSQTVRDMLLSMLVVTGVVLVLVAPWNWSSPDPVREIDPSPVVSGARAAYDWPVLAPRALPDGWRATSARVETAGDGQPVVVLGWIAPDTQYVGLQQSPTRMTDFVRTVTLDGTEQGGAVTLAGRDWTRYVNADGTRRSLVGTSGDVTYVVTGTGDWNEVERFAATLQEG